MASLRISKGDPVKIILYSIITTGALFGFLIVLYRADDEVVAWTMGIFTFFCSLYLGAEVLPRMSVSIDKNKNIIAKDGIGVFDSISRINAKDIKRLTYNKYTTSIVTKKRSLFSNSSNSSSNFTVFIEGNKGEEIEFGFYTTEDKVKRMIDFIKIYGTDVYP